MLQEEKDLHQLFFKITQDACGQIKHGRFKEWLEVIENFSKIPSAIHDADAVRLTAEHISSNDLTQIEKGFKALKPWRKGPFDIFGIKIDAEWRSNLKWDRIKDHINFYDARILDVGSGNGYYAWRMLTSGARTVVGIDPTLISVMQFHAVNFFVGSKRVSVLPLRIEDIIPEQQEGYFDRVFSMGLLYHQPDPTSHLKHLSSLLKPSGVLVLETLVADSVISIIPAGRYAQMKNVYRVPTIEKVTKWLEETGYRGIQLIDVSRTTLDEQRTTPWMPYHSLKDFLDPGDPSKTIEGHPAPQRAAFIARV